MNFLKNKIIERRFHQGKESTVLEEDSYSGSLLSIYSKYYKPDDNKHSNSILELTYKDTNIIIPPSTTKSSYIYKLLNLHKKMTDICETIDNKPSTTLTKSSQINDKSKTLLRQRNLQKAALNSVDRNSEGEDAEDDDMINFFNKEKRLSSITGSTNTSLLSMPITATIKKGSISRDNNKDNDDGDDYDTDSDDEFDKNDKKYSFINTHIIIKFSNNINIKTLHWIIDKIRAKKVNGGAQLLIRSEPNTDPNNQGLTLHITAKTMKFLQLADELEIMKTTKSGIMKNFNMLCLDDFLINDQMDIDTILNDADRQFIIKYALDNIKANENERHIFGMEQIPLYHGQSILEACHEHGIIESIYSLQDNDYLKKLGPNWYKKWFSRQPIDCIREYFGETIAMYFCFVEYYTFATIVPAILGVLQYFLARSAVPFFCIFYVIWMTIFLIVWKRKCSVLAYRWGTITMTNLDTPRAGFYGKIDKDPITGKLQPQYPIWKTYTAMYCVSLPVILVCMLPAAFMAVSQFWLEDQIKQMIEPDSLINWIPSIIESLCVALFSGKYDSLAQWLTNRENHRTQAQYDRHRVVKLIALEFVNNFLSLFYIAFWIGDINLLRSQLLTQLIVFQIVQKLQGTLLPLVMPKLIVLKDSVLGNWYHSDSKAFDELNVVELMDDDPRIEQNKHESTLLEYNSTYEDYLEMYIQFGYVVLFASVAPFAAICSLLNNIIELRLDAYKLCKIYRRPFAKRAKNTGAWLLAFETLLVMSIITNCGLLYLQPEIRSFIPENTSQIDILIVFVIVEHIILAIAWSLNSAIPERPWWVRVALAKSDYESRQAVKREVKKQRN